MIRPNRRMLFPTPIWTASLDDLSEYSEPMIERIEAMRLTDPGLTRSNVGGWHSPDRLHELDEFRPLAAAVMELLHQEVARALLLDTEDHEFFVQTMWSMVNFKHSYNFVHRHPACLFSGVYYLRCSEGSGTLNFHDPRADVRMLRPPLREESEPTYHIIRITPQIGLLVLFPAWLPHDVGPNLNTEPRIALSFNINASRRADRGLPARA